jgi:thymidylate kinase
MDLLPGHRDRQRQGEKLAIEAAGALVAARSDSVPPLLLDSGDRTLQEIERWCRSEQVEWIVSSDLELLRPWVAALRRIRPTRPWPQAVPQPPQPDIGASALAAAVAQLRRKDPPRARRLLRAIELHSAGIDPRLDAFLGRGSSEPPFVIAPPTATATPLQIAVEGIDASGKSTQAAGIQHMLEARGYRAEVHKACRGGAFYDRITGIMRSAEAMGDRTFWRWCRQAKAQDSVRVVQSITADAASRGVDVLIWDRHRLTHLAAALARFEYDPWVEEITHDLPPLHAAFLIDLPVETGLLRLGSRGETPTLDEQPFTLERYRRAFLRLAPAHGYHVIDGRPRATSVTAAVTEIIAALFPRRNTAAGGPPLEQR